MNPITFKDPHTTYYKVKNDKDEFAIVKKAPTEWIYPYTGTPNKVILSEGLFILKSFGHNIGWHDIDEAYSFECWMDEASADILMARLSV